MTYHYPRRPKVKATNGSEGLIFCSSANHGFVVLRFPRHGPETGAGRVEVGDFLGRANTRLGHWGCKASNSPSVHTIQKHHFASAVVLKPWRHVRT